MFVPALPVVPRWTGRCTADAAVVFLFAVTGPTATQLSFIDTAREPSINITRTSSTSSQDAVSPSPWPVLPVDRGGGLPRQMSNTADIKERASTEFGVYSSRGNSHPLILYKVVFTQNTVTLAVGPLAVA